jgi:hypothetical protein
LITGGELSIGWLPVASGVELLQAEIRLRAMSKNGIDLFIYDTGKEQI